MASDELASVKFRFLDLRIRIVPRSIDGVPFTQPGVDILGDEALPLFAKAMPLLEWATTLEPGAKVRAVSLHYQTKRVLFSLDAVPGSRDVRPRAVRVDPPLSERLFECLANFESELFGAVQRVLARR